MNIKLTDIIPQERLQEMQDTFSDATGVASIITDPQGTPLTKPSNFCRLCNDIIRNTEKGNRNCMHSDSVVGRKNENGPTVQRCLSGGLWDAGASINAGEIHMGNWLIGQVRDSSKEDEEVLAYADEIGADRERFSAALKEVKVMSLDQFKKIARMLFLFANQISDMAYSNLALKRSESKIRTTLNSLGDGVISTDRKGNVVQINPMACAMTGWPEDEALGVGLTLVFNAVRAAEGTPIENLMVKVKNIGLPVTFSENVLLISREGKRIQIDDSAAPLFDRVGELAGIVVVFRDVTEKKRLEEQSMQSRKMEALGTLSGGVAHDFNNMLAGIMGSADMILEDPDLDDETRELTETIITASEQAAELTNKLLSFSRRGKRKHASFELHDVLDNALDILGRSVDKKITISRDFGAVNTTMTGDPSQLENVFINLGINSRDAMPRGGRFSIMTSNIYLNEAFCLTASDNMMPGFYIMVKVGDTGIGMTEEQQSHIFEPFYSTKDKSEWNGLGLSSVYGSVREYKGHIAVKSTPGKGTDFTIYLPVHH